MNHLRLCTVCLWLVRLRHLLLLLCLKVPAYPSLAKPCPTLRLFVPRLDSVGQIAAVSASPATHREYRYADVQGFSVPLGEIILISSLDKSLSGCSGRSGDESCVVWILQLLQKN